MTPQESVKLPPLTGPRKAAMFLIGIGDQLSSEVIRQFEPDEILRLNAEISALHSVEPERLVAVLQEFEDLSALNSFLVKGGSQRARRLIEKAMGPETAQKLLEGAPIIERVERLEPQGPFHGVDPAELANVLREENPQTLALVLSNLNPAQAGPLMASLPPEIQPQVALRIALMDNIEPEVFDRIAEAIRARLKASRQLTRSNGARALASILNHVGAEGAEKVLTALETGHQPTADSVRQLMFVFEDIVNIDKEGIKALLARADRKILTVALKGTSEKLKQHFTQCMSQRSAEMLMEDMEALGPVRIGDVTGAQQQLVAVVRKLEKEGAISSGRGGDDEYVM